MKTSEMTMGRVYRLLISAITPRLIAFVSIISKAHVPNLAPFSFFNGISSNPPCIMVSITRNADGSKKDTLVNIEDTGSFVVNVVTHDIVEPMNWCSGNVRGSGMTLVLFLAAAPVAHDR